MVSKSTSMNIELDIIKISQIEPHERYDVDRMERLRSRIFIDGFLDQPLIVDERLGMILDGTHRYHILLNAGIPYVPVIKVSYKNDDIRIGCWYRVYKDLDIRVIENNIVSIGVDPANGYRDRLYIFRDGYIENIVLKDGVETPDALNLLDDYNREKLVKYIDKPRYLDEYVVVGYDPPTKNYIVKRFMEKRLFPVKYTRHLVPIRVLNLRMPLKYLQDIKAAYNYIDHIILTPYKVKVYMEEGYEERYFIAKRRY